MKNKTLSSKGWLILFFATVGVIFLILWPLSNVLIDPFGAFGDPIMKWWSYDATMNPRVAKFSYLEEHHEEYDSYILGCSSTSSYPVEALNEYYDANFYNLIVYGSDLKDTEQMAEYLIDNYHVEHLVVNVYIGNGETYDVGEEGIDSMMPWQVSGTSPLRYYGRYLFADPQYALEKLRCYRKDGYLQAAHDVFNEQTGAYDKSSRDAEGIGALADYVAQPDYAVFADYPVYHRELNETANAAASVARIAQLCRENGVELLVAAGPVYGEAMAWWEREAVEGFYTALAQVTDFWDFSYSSVSFEPRYFYDATHFRNAVGEMMIARIAGEESAYIPADFGALVTADNVAEHMARYWDAGPLPEAELSRELPVLLYHHIVEGEPDNDSTVSAATFEAHMKLLAEAGYTAVTLDDLRYYVNCGTELPEKPVLITFDDGYTSNLSHAAPLLERYGMKATIFTIGVSVGKDTYKDTGRAMNPHFTWAEAAELERSGPITIEGHGYDYHEVEGLDAAPIRTGILQKDGESEADYIRFVEADCAGMDRLFTEHLGRPVSAVAYPYGQHSKLSDVLLSRHGITVTMTTEMRTNTIIKGLPQSLYNLGRYTVTEDTDLISILEQ